MTYYFFPNDYYRLALSCPVQLSHLHILSWTCLDLDASRTQMLFHLIFVDVLIVVTVQSRRSWTYYYSNVLMVLVVLMVQSRRSWTYYYSNVLMVLVVLMVQSRRSWTYYYYSNVLMVLMVL